MSSEKSATKNCNKRATREQQAVAKSRQQEKISKNESVLKPMCTNSLLSSLAALGQAATLMESVSIFSMEDTWWYQTGMWLIGTQFVCALLLAFLLGYEIITETKEFACWEKYMIIAFEVFDMLLEIAIVIISFQLFEEYNEHRHRPITFGQLAEKVQEIPEPANITISFILLLVFATISFGLDVYETIDAYRKLKLRKY